PLFFVVGGYANRAAWEAVRREGGGARRFWAKRFERLLRPVAVYVTCWAIVDLAVRAGGGRSVLEWGMVVFVPLWFLGVYVAVVTLTPWTTRLHDARPWATLVLLGAGVAVADVLRLGAGVDAAGLPGSALVWVFAHQLGYVWRDWSVPGTAVCRTVRWFGERSATVTTVLVGLGGLVALTTFGPYSRSMVAVRGEDVSNMFPTTACVAALAVFQLGVVLAVAAPLRAWLQRRSVWKAVVAANAVAMTVFCWHMTALVGFLLAYEAAGFTLGDEPTAAWWLARPLWVVGPGVLLAGLLAVFARVELPKRPAAAPGGRPGGGRAGGGRVAGGPAAVTLHGGERGDRSAADHERAA
ncbi:MAG TPA: acyltransferase family protein, partial [Acidimicrobiales bacterium]